MSEGADFPRRPAIDWRAARAAVIEADKRLRRMFDDDPALHETLLAQRTIELAQPPQADEVPGRPVLVLSVPSGRFAVPLADALRVERLRRWTPIPQAPPELIGIAAFQGEPCLLADLEAMIGGEAGTFVEGYALLLRRKNCCVALCVERIEDVQPFLAPDEGKVPHRHVVAVDSGHTALLDIDSIVHRAIHWDGSP